MMVEKYIVKFGVVPGTAVYIAGSPKRTLPHVPLAALC
jgi:hypothetical protein